MNLIGSRRRLFRDVTDTELTVPQLPSRSSAQVRADLPLFNTKPCTPGEAAMIEKATPWVPAGRCGLLAVDVVDFGRRESAPVQKYVRARLYALIESSLENSGVDFRQCYTEDRGDGLVLAIPPSTPTERLVDPFVGYVRAGLRLHNLVSNELAQLQLRVALHSGATWTDPHGLVGDSVIHLFRLLDAPSFKQLMRRSGAYLAVIASNAVYEEIIRHAPGLVDPDDYAEIPVEHKELSGTGWVRLLGPVNKLS
jgi:hypothetical protein